MTDSRLTVLRVIDRLNVGGPAIHAAVTTRGLDPTSFRTILVAGSVEDGEADMSYLLDDYGIEHVEIPALGRELRPLRDLTTAWQLYKVIRRERPDIVHTHKSKAGAIGRVVAFVAGVPVRIHTFHGHVLSGYFGPTKTRMFLAIERLLAMISTRLIALSDGLVDEMSDRLRVARRDRFSVIRLGLPLEQFTTADRHRGELRARLGVDDKVKLVGIVGRMVPVKDHATFVAAAALVAERRPDVHFVFVGGGELEATVHADLERRGLLPRSHLIGWCRDLFRIYPDLDVVALCSINEGTPVALIEALAAGVPVVGTSVGGVPEVLANGRRGTLVQPRDEVALANAIEHALSAEARERAAEHSREIVEEYGEHRLCRDLEGLYRQLASRADG